MATKKQSKRLIAKKEEDIAAREAAEEAVEELEASEEFEDDGANIEFGEDQLQMSATDVFEEGFKKAVLKKDAPRYHIKKNSQFLTVKDYPYSWERLQAEYGAGYYQVICKGRSSGHILKQQTESVAESEEAQNKNVATESDYVKQDSNMAILAMMNQFQERADDRAKQESRSGESSLASVMQTVVQVQQQSTQLMMTMMQESNKQTQSLIMAMMQQNQAPKGPDPVMALLTTLLTQKDKSDGFTAGGVMKMVQDAEIRAENRATKTFEMIDKKANELADIKAEALSGSDEGENESFTKTLVKGFLPVLSQLAQQKPPTPEQVAHMQMLEGRGAQQGLDQGFIENHGTRPAIAAPRHAVSNVRPQPASRPNPQAPARPVQAAQNAPIAQNTVQKSEVVQDLAAISRFKDQLFTFCAADIGQAMLNGDSASKTGEICLMKLEKEGVPRQTVANTFELKDFYAYADQYGLPAEAKTWLKEFHETLQAAGLPKPVPAASEAVARPEPVREPDKVVASEPKIIGSSAKVEALPNGAAHPKPKSRGGKDVRARTRSRESAKNI